MNFQEILNAGDTQQPPGPVNSCWSCVVDQDGGKDNMIAFSFHQHCLGKPEKRIIDREIVAITRFGTLIEVSYSYINQQIANRSKYFQSNEKSAIPLHEHLTIQSALKMLQLDENATQKEIKRAYRKLAAKVHPDKFEQESTEKQLEMKANILEIQLAYNYLIN